MAKKEFIGLTYEDNRLRMARLRVVKNGLELLEVDTIDLPHPISTVHEPGIGDLDFSEDYEEIFELDPANPSSKSGSDFDDFDDFDGSGSGTSREKKESTDLEDSFDMTKTEDEAEAERDNEQLLADYLSQYGNNKIRIGTHIPFGRTTFQVLKNANPGSMKKSERHEFFRDKLQPVYDQEINPDQYSWVQIDENNCLLAYSADEYNFINLLELSETYLKKKVLIHELLPDEAIWAGLARTNYTLAKDDITGLIAIGSSSSRVLFMKGKQIVNVLPIITEGESSNDILNTIFSKILFEIDKGDLPRINRLLLVRSAKMSEKAKKYFSTQFEDVEVDFLTPHHKHLSYADEILNSPVYLQPYMTAIGAAWAASGVHEKEFSQLSLLPEYIREKQRVLKLEWHGILILILIALTPLFLNYLYQTRSNELTELQQEIRLLNTQIDELRPVATMTEDLMAETAEIQTENERLYSLAQYSQQWSETIRMLNEGVFEIPNLWLTSLSTSNNNSLQFEGFSLTREQIPEFASLFTDGNIQSVSETDIRGQTVYSFTMRVNNIRQDMQPFLIDLPQRNYDAEQGSEIEINYSSTDEGPEQEFYDESSGNVTQSPATAEQPDPVSGGSQGSTSSQTPQPPTSTPVQANTETTNEPQREISVPAIVSPTNSSSSYGLMGPEEQLLEGAYTIVLHSITDSERAKHEEETLKDEGYKATLWDVILADNRTWWRIGVGQFETVSSALEAVQELPDEYRERNFIIRIREGQ